MVKALAIVGDSGTGKTQLICRLLSWFADQRLRVAVLKHSHKITLGDEAKDTGRFRQAGASLVALTNPGLLQVTRVTNSEPPLNELLKTLSSEADLILVEGYKTSPLPKIAVLPPQPEGAVPPYPHLIALVSGHFSDTPLPVFKPEAVRELGQFIKEYLDLP